MGPTPNSLIRVDAQTGLVLTNMEVDSTFSNQWYNYVVVAKDQGVPQNSDTATIMIHVTSDGEVQFNQSSYSFTIVENLPAGNNTTLTYRHTAFLIIQKSDHHPSKAIV